MDLEKLRVVLPLGHILLTLINEHDLFLNFLEVVEKSVMELEKKGRLDRKDPHFKTLDKISDYFLNVGLHHRREEELLIPALIEAGIVPPNFSMQEEHQAARERKKEFHKVLSRIDSLPFNQFLEQLKGIISRLVEESRQHIFVENTYLFPKAYEELKNEKIWNQLKEGSHSIGYCSFEGF